MNFTRFEIGRKRDTHTKYTYFILKIDTMIEKETKKETLANALKWGYVVPNTHLACLPKR